jgi:hypothetical protein
MDINLTDLTKLVAISGAAFAVLRVVVGRPLIRQIINPNRTTCLITAFSFLVGSVGILREQTSTSNPLAWLSPLKHLVTEEKASGPVMVAGFALLNSFSLLGLVAYCFAKLPRDPKTFSSRKQLPKVIQYYTALSGGLDFAVLIRLAKTDGAKPEIIAMGVNRSELQTRLEHLVPYRTVDTQIEWWKALSLEIQHELERLNGPLGRAGQGHNRRVLLDVQFGGYLFQYLRPPEVGHDIVFLFAATLLQQEVDNRQFEDHFELMVKAVQSAVGSTEKL